VAKLLVCIFSTVALLAAQQPSTAPDEADQPLKTSVQNPDAVAIVIGIAQYQDRDIPPAAYATNDADAVARVVTDTLGFVPGRVIQFKNEQAALTRIRGAVRQRLPALIQPGKSDIFVYYSGHGEPNVQTKDGYLIPWEFDSQDVPTSDTAYAIKDLYSDLAKLGARSVTVILEACFTGQSKSGPLIKGARPLTIEVNDPAESLTNGLVITASGAAEIASDHPQQPHGLMTYYWLRAMRGEAADDQGRVTPQKLKQYLQQNVSNVARSIQRAQTPEVVAALPNSEVVRLPISALRTGNATVVQRNGGLEIFIDRGGDLTIDGVPQGTIAPGRTFLVNSMPAGPHRIEVRKQGYQPQQEDIIILPDQTTRKTYLLTDNRGATATATVNRPNVTPPNTTRPNVASDTVAPLKKSPATGFKLRHASPPFGAHIGTLSVSDEHVTWNEKDGPKDDFSITCSEILEMKKAPRINLAKPKTFNVKMESRNYNFLADSSDEVDKIIQTANKMCGRNETNKDEEDSSQRRQRPG
jgi:hypothetical protein